jgi:hypothetical protein
MPRTAGEGSSTTTTRRSGPHEWQASGHADVRTSYRAKIDVYAKAFVSDEDLFLKLEVAWRR